MTKTTIKAGYKQTEIGVIPEDWEVKKLGEITFFVASGTSVTKNEKGGIYPLYGSTGIIGYRKNNDYSGYKILVARVGANAGTVNKVQGDYSVSDNTLIIAYQSNVSIDFQYYQLIGYNLNKLVFGSGQPLITGGQLRNLSFPLPPKPEQTLIATTLSDTDELISSLDALIHKKRRIKEGAMQELLTGKKRLAGFIGEWEVKKLGEIADIIMGQSPKSAFYNQKGEGLPLIQGNADIKYRTTIIRNYTSEITKFGKKEMIIMTVRAPVGEIAKASFDCCLGRGVCGINFKNQNEFLFHYLIYLESYWIKLSKGSTFDSVNSDEVKTLLIHIPPTLEEQQAIAKILSDMDTEITALEQKRDKYKLIKQGMMQQLLTGKIRLI